LDQLSADYKLITESLAKFKLTIMKKRELLPELKKEARRAESRLKEIEAMTNLERKIEGVSTRLWMLKGTLLTNAPS
jgi:hypothetical protein